MGSIRPDHHTPPSTTTPSSSSASASTSSRLTTPFTTSQREYLHHQDPPRRRTSQHRSAEKAPMLAAHAPGPGLPLLRPYTEIMPAPGGMMPHGFIDNEHAPRHAPGAYGQSADVPRAPIVQPHFPPPHSSYAPLLAHPPPRPLPQIALDHPQLPLPPLPHHPPLPPPPVHTSYSLHGSTPALAMPRRPSRTLLPERSNSIIAAPAPHRRPAQASQPHGLAETPLPSDISASRSNRRRSSHGQNQSGFGLPNQHPVESPPSILTREKKQKACAGCRRAKLKCITEEGQTECIRCRARNEKCYFYPRNHDEDWQQTISTDLYAAVPHLAELSKTVHHMFTYLVQQRVLPEPPFPIFQPYEAPERDMAGLHPWTDQADTKHDVSTTIRSQGEKRKRSQCGEDQAAHRTSPPGPGVAAQSSQAPMMSPIQAVLQPVLTSPATGLLPPFSQTAPAAAGGRTLTYWSEPLSQPRTIMISPTQSLTLATSSAPAVLSTGGQVLVSPLVSPIGVGLAGELPLVDPSTVSPIIALMEAAPPPLATPSHTSPAQTPSGTSVIMNTPGPGQPVPEPTPAEECPQIASQVLDEEGEEIYGSADGRQTMVTKGIVPAVVARRLVTYFHQHIAPHLFGYSLKLRRFPYLPDGPRSITPFILAVECLLASERVAELSQYHARLAEETTDMMIKSPAESWMSFPGYKASPSDSSQGNDTKGEQVLGHAVSALSAITADENWEPELGIGPEEIVAACLLAAFISERDQAKVIAVCAFTWVKGWTKYLMAGPQDETMAESIGMITPLRRPKQDQVARVWLLAYIVAAQEFFNHNHADEVFPTDISTWCNIILPPTPSPSTSGAPSVQHDKCDVLLVFQARLHALKLQWLTDRARIVRGAEDPDAMREYVKAHKRLGDRMNSQLDWWAEDLDAYGLEDVTKRQIHLDWLYARQIVNSVLVNNICGGPEEEQMRLGHMRISGECALTLLVRCESWDPPGSLANLPHTYFRMIALATAEVADMLAAADHGKIPAAICPITVTDFLPILVRVCQKLLQTEVNDNHYCRQTASSIRASIDTLGLIPDSSPVASLASSDPPPLNAVAPAEIAT